MILQKTLVNSQPEVERSMCLPRQDRWWMRGLNLQAELIDGRSQLAALRETYSEDSVKVRALEAHNAELQRELDKMSGVGQGSGANPDANSSPYPTANELPSRGLTYFDLERKMRVQESLWEALTRQYEAAKVGRRLRIFHRFAS